MLPSEQQSCLDSYGPCVSYGDSTYLWNYFFNMFQQCSTNINVEIAEFYEEIENCECVAETDIEKINVTQSYETSIDVKQFHNCSLRITYGNIQQKQLDYLDVVVRDLQFINCMQNLKQEKYHSSCQECDGPLSIIAQLILWHQKGYILQKLNNVLVHTEQLMIIMYALIIWTKIQIEQATLNLMEIKCKYMEPITKLRNNFSAHQNIRYKQITLSAIENFNFYDSSDIIATNIPNYDSFGISIQDDIPLYQHFRFSTQIFISFCNTFEPTMYDQHLCYVYNYELCLSCSLKINNDFLCLKCQDQYQLGVGKRKDSENFNYASCFVHQKIACIVLNIEIICGLMSLASNTKIYFSETEVILVVCYVEKIITLISNLENVQNIFHQQRIG
ncbi:unnamed protein product [Paramecium octaurelia]|uniref:Uncharacterized protein n=1 Tax=Paramecium octaurelia TaxID=43137 RepID=A0A8S1YM05_PAROT|nr:unnamed protein product [Paramecium octaurelia]